MNFYDGKLGIFNFAASGSAYVYNPGLKANLSKDPTYGLYTITFDDGTIYHFGLTLKIASITDRYGNSLSFTYNLDNELTTVTDTLGRNIAYTYNDSSRLQKVTDFNGRTVELAYFGLSETGGSVSDLKSVTITSGTGTNALSKTTSFTYDSSHNIITLTDAKGQVYVQTTYDTNNRATSQIYGSGTVNYSYTLSGSSVYTNDVTNANGVHTRYTYDSNGNTVEREIFDSTGTGETVYNYQFDSNARLAKTILPKGNGTTYKYDTRGNIIEQREKANANAVDGTGDLVTTYQYDGVYDVPVKVVLPNGLEKDFTLDSSGNILSETATGILNADNTTYTTTTNYTYDTNGQLTRKTDPEGNVTSYTYGSGQLLMLTHGSGDTIQETFTYDDYGNLLSSTDGEGKTKTLTYTPFNLLATETTTEGIETRFTYDANNNKTHEEMYSPTGSAIGAIDYEYDILDHLTKKTEHIDATSSKVITMIYDGNGNLLTTQENT